MTNMASKLNLLPLDMCKDQPNKFPFSLIHNSMMISHTQPNKLPLSLTHGLMIMQFFMPYLRLTGNTGSTCLRLSPVWNTRTH